MHCPVAFLSLLILPVVAHAAPVTIEVRVADGQPLADAVVMVEVARGPGAVPHGSYVTEQKAIAFQPHVLIVPAGAATIRVWSHGIPAPGNILVQSATIAATGLSTTLTIRR